MIYIGNIEILTAKSAIYLGNVGIKLAAAAMGTEWVETELAANDVKADELRWLTVSDCCGLFEVRLQTYPKPY